jgi:hypothetical protein
MEPDDSWGFALVKMALDGVPHIAAKLLRRFGFGKDGLAKGAGGETAIGRLFDEENQFVHLVRRRFLVIEDLTSGKELCDIETAGKRRVCKGRRQRWQPERVGYSNLGPATRKNIMSVTIQLDLPEALVNEARNNGLLESQRLGEMLNEELRRERARKDLGRMLKELHSLPGEPMTAEEIQVEIDAVRAERRQRESRR